MRLLILGGTAEAVSLARELVERGHDVTTSLAGRTREPSPILGRVRIGGFGGAQGMVDFIRSERIAALIDATHPFAERISANAALACEHAPCPRCVLQRPAWREIDDERWIAVRSISEAAVALPSEATVLLALGRQHLAPFTQRGDVRFVVRSIEPVVGSLPPQTSEVLARPSRHVGQERGFLLEHGIEVIVSRNSGGEGAYAKIEAARTLGLPVVMIDRPAAVRGPQVAKVSEAVAWVDTLQRG